MCVWCVVCVCVCGVGVCVCGGGVGVCVCGGGVHPMFVFGVFVCGVWCDSVFVCECVCVQAVCCVLCVYVCV